MGYEYFIVIFAAVIAPVAALTEFYTKHGLDTIYNVNCRQMVS